MLVLFIYLYIRFLLVGPGARDMCSPSETYLYVFMVLFIYLYIRFLLVGPGARDMCSPSETYLYVFMVLFIYLYIRFLLVGPGARDMCSPSETYLYVFIYIYIYIYIYIACVLIVVLSLFSMICMALIEDQSETNKLVKLSHCGLVRAGLILEFLVSTG